MFADPIGNLKYMSIKEGDKIVDFGAGVGYYALAMAKKVGDKGQIYAVDVQRDLLQKLKDESRERRISNVHIIWGDFDKVGGTKLADNFADSAVVSNVFFQSGHKKNFIKEIHRVLKNGGEVMIIDWTDSFGGIGPHPDEVVTEAQALQLFQPEGFKLIKSFPAGDHHWGMVMKKN